MLFRSEKEPISDGFRIAPDGVLEREVKLPSPCNLKWVPVVPDGMSTLNMTWKRWLFCNMHIGLLGAHRNAEKTYTLLVRQVWWRTMKKEVDKWVQTCITCVRVLEDYYEGTAACGYSSGCRMLAGSHDGP